MGREIDVRDSPIVSMKGMLYRGIGSDELQVPDKSLLVGCADNPVVTRCEGGPLDIGYLPRRSMDYVTWR